MRERPILFQGAMVRALLAGTKTQTRRVCKAAKCHDDGEDYRDTDGWPLFDASIDGAGDIRITCPYGQPGDRLWVREAWAVGHGYDGMPPRAIPELPFVKRHYAATEDRGGLLWRPSIHMPRWVSRITLEVTGVRVERLQDICEADAQAEGCDPIETSMHGKVERTLLDLPLLEDQHPFRNGYALLWDTINGPGSWDANPWLWVVEFRRLP